MYQLTVINHFVFVGDCVCGGRERWASRLHAVAVQSSGPQRDRWDRNLCCGGQSYRPRHRYTSYIKSNTTHVINLISGCLHCEVNLFSRNHATKECSSLYHFLPCWPFVNVCLQKNVFFHFYKIQIISQHLCCTSACVCFTSSWRRSERQDLCGPQCVFQRDSSP